MMTTITIGKRGTLVIPKSIREECQLNEGTKMDVSVENNTIVLAASIHTRTRMDDNFDQARAVLRDKGITLEMALARLTALKDESRETEPQEA